MRTALPTRGLFAVLAGLLMSCAPQRSEAEVSPPEELEATDPQADLQGGQAIPPSEPLKPSVELPLDPVRTDGPMNGYGRVRPTGFTLVTKPELVGGFGRRGRGGEVDVVRISVLATGLQEGDEVAADFESPSGAAFFRASKRAPAPDALGAVRMTFELPVSGTVIETAGLHGEWAVKLDVGGAPAGESTFGIDP